MTVVIPTYNRATFIGQAIQSVIDQEGVRTEIVVVDDGSTDNTGEIVAPFGDRVRYMRQANKREGAARNAGVKVASGEVIAFLDSDDSYLPGKLKRDLDAFGIRPNAGMVYSPAIYVDDHGTILRTEPTNPPLTREVDALVRGNFVPMSSTAVSAIVLREVGGFSELPEMSGSYDWQLWVRIAARRPLMFVPVAGTRIRSTAGNMMSDPARMEGSLLAAARSFAQDPYVRESLAAGTIDVEAWTALQRALLWAFGDRRRAAAGFLLEGLRRDPAIALDGRFWKAAARSLLGRTLWSGAKRWFGQPRRG